MSIPNTSVLNNKFFLRTFFKGNFEKENAFIPLYSGFYNYVISKQMNSNKYYITISFIPYNTYF